MQSYKIFSDLQKDFTRFSKAFFYTTFTKKKLVNQKKYTIFVHCNNFIKKLNFMSEEKDFIEVDDTECIKFILNFLPEELKGKVSDDDIQYVLDLICEYYAENDLIEEDTVEEATIAEEDMYNFILAAIRKEKVVEIDEYTLEVILDGEFEYGKKIGIYTEE